VYASNFVGGGVVGWGMRIQTCLTALMCALVGGAVSLADAQDDGGGKGGEHEPKVVVPTPRDAPDVKKPATTLGEVFAQIQTQPDIRRAGLKAGLLRRAQVTVPVVVIVKDASGFLDAISSWEAVVRFPILWDDGSVESREHIARFVRGFKPEHVVELGSSDEWNWSGDRTKKQGIFERALSKAIDEKKTDWQSALADLEKTGIVSPGIVVTDVNDTTWASALALSAGRMQPVVFVEKRTSVYQPMSTVNGDALERAIEHGARETGRSWRGIGDEIDAITLALNTGTMIKVGEQARDRLATSDRIGRLDSNGSGARWAWCGQIIGNESRSVYQAMCSLFLSIDQAFVWDGYSSDPPWGTYDGTLAGQALEEAGLVVELNDEPRNTMADWKRRTVRAVGEPLGENGSAGLFLMNSKGASNVFDLPGVVDGSGKPGHMPIFEVPMALHVVHSFSLQYPTNRDTIGGRLIERGVYMYAGSVDEPYLSAFVPTPAIARRLAGSLAFATAVHFDDGKVWKVAVLGDPLVTIGPAGRRAEGSIQIPGAEEIDLRYKDRLKAGEYAGAIEDLVVLGRDEAVARIAAALMKDKPEAMTPGAALVSIPSLFRAGEYNAMVDAFERLDALGQTEPMAQDLLWLASPYLLSRAAGDSGERSRIEALLRANIREHQKIQDAEALAMHMRRRSLAGAVGVLESLRPTLNGNQAKQLDRAIARVRK